MLLSEEVWAKLKQEAQHADLRPLVPFVTDNRNRIQLPKRSFVILATDRDTKNNFINYDSNTDRKNTDSPPR
jgi:hypothetical protein